MKKTNFCHIVIILALFVCTMPKLTRSSTCLDLGITQTCNVRQKVKAYLDQGKKPCKNMNQTCLQPWNWKMTCATHSLTKLKKSSALSKLSENLGYKWEESNNMEVTSKLFTKKVVDSNNSS